MGAAGAIIIGVFAPWASIIAPFVGKFSLSGMDADRGQLSLIVNLAAGGAVVLRAFRGAGARAALGAGVGFLMIGLLALWFIIDVWSSDTGDFALMTVGWGAYLVAIAAVVGMVAACIEWLQAPNRVDVLTNEYAPDALHQAR